MKRPLLAVCALVVCLIALWQALFPPALADHALAGERVYLYGQVVSKEYRLSNGQEKSILYVSNVLLFSNLPPFFGETIPNHVMEQTEYGEAIDMASNEQVMVYLAETKVGEMPSIGSYVLLQGTLVDFDLPRNTGEFNSRLYYVSLGIAMQMYQGILLWQEPGQSLLKEGMWQLKNKWTNLLIEKLGQEQGSVLATIVLGSKERLDAGMKSLYQESGISHILAISGLHISLVGMSLYKICRKLGAPPPVSALLGIASIVLYGVFADAGPSAFRAAGMFVIRMLGIMLKRNYDMLTSLGVLFAFMVIQNPLYLYHTGCLLSFAAMLGIGCIYPLLEGNTKSHRYREGVAKLLTEVWQKVQQALLFSFSVTVVTLPIMCLTFYEIAPYSMVLNLVILPLLPALFILGILLIVVPDLGISTIFCTLTKLVLNLYAWLAEGSISLPGSRLIVGGVSTFRVLFYIVVLGMLILCGKRISRQACFKLLFIAVLLMTTRVNFGSEISFLDVGQGDGIFVQTKAGCVYMVDGGSSSEKEIGKYTLAPFLKSKGVREIEGWIITHPDADHCNGLASVLEAGYGSRVKRIFLPDVSQGSQDETYASLVLLAEEYQIPVYYLSAGMQWEEEGTRFLCLNPPAQATLLTSNEYSIALYLELENYNFLLTGDVEGEGEEYLTAELTARGIGHVNVLKVAHHGSKNATLSSFLDVIDADIAVISCGAKNSYGHPHAETLKRLEEDGAQILQTKESGEIDF